MYVMVCTRPDLEHVVSIVSRHLANYEKSHWEGAKWIMRYLRGSTKVGLFYGKLKKQDSYVMGFVDTYYAGDLDTRRSLTGFVFQIFGCTVSWKASLQHVVALSTTEAEYIAVTEAVKEALWLKELINELGVKQETITMFSDSQSAIYLTKNQMFHGRTKHIDIRVHFIRKVIARGDVKMEKVRIKDNLADMLTKSLPTAKFDHCQSILRVTGKNCECEDK